MLTRTTYASDVMGDDPREDWLTETARLRCWQRQRRNIWAMHGDYVWCAEQAAELDLCIEVAHALLDEHLDAWLRDHKPKPTDIPEPWP